jgi:hypothetical protein
VFQNSKKETEMIATNTRPRIESLLGCLLLVALIAAGIGAVLAATANAPAPRTAR